uniref:Uncharacterized protein n=1 Tax=viral metagenome TaxID=1070528 RepID=A0A6C0E483_9ZZZZ
MSQYLSAISNKLQTMLNNLSGKFTKTVVKPTLAKGTYEKINKDLENYFIREGMSQAIAQQQDLTNRLIAIEGFLYDGLHGNLIMQLRDNCDADDTECLGNNLTAAAEVLKDKIVEAFRILNIMMGRPASEFIVPDENARILFLVELLCSNQPIEYRTSVNEDLNTLIQQYCQFPNEPKPSLPESVQPLPKKQRLGIPSGPSTRYVPGMPPEKFDVVLPPADSAKNIWNPSGGKKARKTRRKYIRVNRKTNKRKTNKRRKNSRRRHK